MTFQKQEQKPKAIRLAETLEAGFECDLEWYELEAAKELRRLYTENERLNYQLPRLTAIAHKKLVELTIRGYEVSGYAIYHPERHQHGFVTTAGLVGWWRPDQHGVNE